MDEARGDETNRGLKILIVEDEKITADVYRNFLVRYFDRVLTAVNGQEGLELFRAERPEIVIADIVMPVLDGLEMSRTIKEISPDTQIIVSTAYMDTAMMQRAIEAGVDHYISKPFRSKYLLSIIDKSVRTLRRYQSAQEEIRRLSELLFAIKNISELIVQTDRQELLLKKICELLVTRRLYTGAWIVLINDLGRVTWAHQVGIEQKDFEIFLERLNAGESVFCIKTADAAVRNGDVVHDKKNNCEGCHLATCVEDNASFVFRLEYNKKVYGYMNISISEKIVNRRDEFDLLMDAANDISFALNRFELVENGKKNEELMIHQSRLAAMGEMISMIAHQWRQPLAAISMSSNNMQLDIELDQINGQTFKSHLEAINRQVMYLSKTIDDFKNFFHPHKKRKRVHVGTIVEQLKKMIGESLQNNGIAFLVDQGADGEMLIYENELMHVLINIIKNAKDELLAKSVEKGWVKLTAGIDEKKVKFVIEDNGGGIPPENLLRVFEPYFSTKGENGTGLGLYMSDIIITKNFGGMIRAENTEAGACFTVEIPLK